MGVHLQKAGSPCESGLNIYKGLHFIKYPEVPHQSMFSLAFGEMSNPSVKWPSFLHSSRYSQAGWWRRGGEEGLIN